MRRSGERRALVLVESGATVPAGLDRSVPESSVPNRCRVIAIDQRADEEPGAFMVRALCEMAALERSEVAIDVGAVVCNERTDPHQLASRELMTHALAAAVSRSGGKLLLCADPNVAPDVRLAMLELFKQLVHGRPGLEVRLHFESAALKPPPRRAGSGPSPEGP